MDPAGRNFQSIASAAEPWEDLRLITNTMAAAVSCCRSDHRYAWVSPRYAEWLGLPAGELTGRSIVDVLGSDAYTAIRPFIDQVLSGETAQFEALINYSSIGPRWIHAVYVPTYDKHKKVDGWVADISDITELKRAHEDLARANALLLKANESLARSNKDLERFALVASHDLQEPLRVIATYTQLLAGTQAARLDADASMFMQMIVDRTKRMSELLTDLLAYTELATRPPGPERLVDLNEILEKVRQNLQGIIDENGAVVTWDAQPAMPGHEGNLIPLFQNLIGNAIKYRGESPPTIHISVDESEDHFLFTVADNGIGIDPAYHNQIFEPFKRLHNGEISGTGIGLAICHRVIERYGGSIWVESEVGRGAKFNFLLPRV
jgi:PAS domain S-box-containing protein